MIYAHSPWVKNGKTKLKNVELEHYTVWNSYIQGGSRISNITVSFAEHVTQLESGHYTFWKCFMQGALS